MKKLILLAAAVILACLPTVPAAAAPVEDLPTTTPIQHVVWMMQDNHSFDNYFGTYPGDVDGIPEGVCQRLNLNRVSTRGCVQPFHIGDTPIEDLSQGPGVQRRQYNGGRMDGFVAAYRRLGLDGSSAMGYYDGRDIPFHWNVADQYVLFDRFFASTTVGSREAYLYWVAGQAPTGQTPLRSSAGYDALPTIFDRLHERGISAKFYVENLDPAAHSSQLVKVPLLSMKRFSDGGALGGQVVDLSQYYLDLRNGTLPAVSYIVTTGSSENPPGDPSAGSSTLRKITNELMKSSAWSSSALMWTYDGWGGWYDHVPPPRVDSRGYGFRVPALLVSPYAKRGVVDHTVLDYTAMLQFIETNWNVEPLSTRDRQSVGLTAAFDFNAPPRPPTSLPWTWPAPQVRAATDSPAPVIYGVYGMAAALAIAIVGLAARWGPTPISVARATVLVRSSLTSVHKRAGRFQWGSRYLPSSLAPSAASLSGDATEPLRSADAGRAFLTVPHFLRPRGLRDGKDRLIKWYRGTDRILLQNPNGHAPPSNVSLGARDQKRADKGEVIPEPNAGGGHFSTQELLTGARAETGANADTETQTDPAAIAESAPEAQPATTTDADAEWPIAWWIEAHPLSATEVQPATTADADAEWPVAWWIEEAAHNLPATEAQPATTTDAVNPITATSAAGAAVLADHRRSRRQPRKLSRSQRRKLSRR
jgi:phospholipase C